MKTTLQELTIKNNFMFAAVMTEPDNCRELIERALEIEIDHVVVDKEKSIIYNPEYKSIRLDVYAKDDVGSHFNVEMQVARTEIVKRARYYHSEIDMDILLAGKEYERLPNTYVIFICDYDPFGFGKYRYTVKRSFLEKPEYDYDDGSYTVFLSTKGKNRNDVPKELVSFLEYAGADSTHAEDDFHDEYVKQLQQTVTKIKNDREMGVRYMLFSELLKDEFQAGKAEGLSYAIIQVLAAYGSVPKNLETKITQVTDSEVLCELLNIATISSTVEEFEAQAKL